MSTYCRALAEASPWIGDLDESHREAAVDSFMKIPDLCGFCGSETRIFPEEERRCKISLELKSNCPYMFEFYISLRQSETWGKGTIFL
jgi:hypothetical protein